MERCPHCNYMNAETNAYCERCGTLLKATTSNSEVSQTFIRNDEETVPAPYEYSTPTTGEGYEQSEIPPPPPPPMYNPAYTLQPGQFNPPVAATESAPRTRSVGAAVHSAFWYLWGLFCFTFGIAGFLLQHVASTTIGFTFLALCFIGIIGLVLLLVFRKYLFLRSWLRFGVEIGLLVLAGIMLFVVAAIESSAVNSGNYYSFGFVFAIYGFIAAAVAFW
jgi:hypothetical protein